MAHCALWPKCKRPAECAGHCLPCYNNLRSRSLESKETIAKAIDLLELRLARHAVVKKPPAGGWLAILLVKRKRRAETKPPTKAPRNRRATHHAPAIETHA